MYSCVIRTVEYRPSTSGDVLNCDAAGYVGKMSIHDAAAFNKEGALCYPISGFVGLKGSMLTFAGVLRKNLVHPGYIARLGLENDQGTIDKVFLLENYGGIIGYYSGIFVHADLEKEDLEKYISHLESTIDKIRHGKLDRSRCKTAEFEIRERFANFNV
jgi:hypothetical protein